MTDPAERGLGRAVAIGAGAWFGYAVLFVALKGTSFDEVLTPAQVITNVVRYPAGHPFQLYYKEVYSLFHYLAAALYAVVPNVTFVAGIFNLAFLFTSAFVPFALATVLTRRVALGYLTGALVMTGAGLILQWRYPMYVFPEYFSNGHIGTGLAVLAVAFVIGGFWSWAGLVVGILPAVHGAMAALVWPWVALYWLLAPGKPRGGERRRFLAWAGVGIAVCAALAAAILYQRGEAVVMPPYIGEGDADQIYRDFTLRADFHRHLFSVLSPGFLLNPVAFALLGALLWIRGGADRDARRSQLVWLLGFGGLAWAVGFGAWLYRSGVGLLPRPLEMLMPFRFSNLTAALNLPLGVALAAVTWPRLASGARQFWLGAFALVLVVVAVALGAAPSLVKDYFLFVWWLLLGALVLLDRDGSGRLETWVAIGLAGLGFASTAAVGVRNHHAVAVGLGLAIGCGTLVLGYRWLARTDRPGIDASLRRAVVAAGVAVSLTAALGYRPMHAFNHVSTFDRSLAEWLARNSSPTDLILPAAMPLSKAQPKTGHPILADWGTLYIIAYMPQLGPAIRILIRDVYGIDFGDPAHLDAKCPGGWVSPGSCIGYDDIWKQRSRNEWSALRARYDVRFVLSRSEVPLTLPAVFPGPDWTLYAIPEPEVGTARPATAEPTGARPRP